MQSETQTDKTEQTNPNELSVANRRRQNWLANLLHSCKQINPEKLTVEDIEWGKYEGVMAWSAAHVELHERLEPAFLIACKLHRQQLNAQELAAAHWLKRVDACFSLNHIFGLVVKGEALAQTLYPPATRARTDIDLWVAPKQFDLTRQLLISLGLIAENNAFGALILPEQRMIDPGGQVVIDLHLALFSRPALARSIQFEEIFRSGQSLPGLQTIRAPNKADAIVIAALHRVAHHAFERNRTIWLLDFVLLATDRANILGAIQSARKIGAIALLRDAILSTQIRFNIQLVEPITLLDSDPLRYEPLAALLEPRGQIATWWLDLKLIPEWRLRLQYLGELFFPPENYLAQRNQNQSKLNQIAAYWKRIWRGAWRHLNS